MLCTSSKIPITFDIASNHGVVTGVLKALFRSSVSYQFS
ncbi:hypothetical protein BVRB_6g127920 isoform B [Beta vulgaris subsp. vulgaris]|nr:hypothetical protein BVRB_6g127920 isoform B [Beta vulgaris subsp. vulgaris]